MSAFTELGVPPPQAGFPGPGLRALADAALLDPDDRGALAEALRRLREEDDSTPAVLSHDDTP